MPPVVDADGLDALSITDLRKKASAAGLKGAYRGPKKADLIAFLRSVK